MANELGEHTRIIFLASNPYQPTHPTDPAAEVEAIREALEADGVVRALPLYADQAATTDALYDALLRAPNAKILHLYGHGSAKHGWLTHDADGQTVGVRGDRLARLLKTFSNIQVLVLSACHQLTHLKPLAQHIEVVIGSSDKLQISSARSFNRAFYRGLAAGITVGDAYERAAAMAGIDTGAGADALHLEPRPGTDPRYLRIDPYRAPQPATEPKAEPAPDEATRFERSQAALAQRFDGHDDVVITSNLLGDWRRAVPHPQGAAPLVIDVETGVEAWQRRYPPDRGRWQKALDATRAAVADAKKSRRSRVHVAVKLPFSLGAVLGSELEQHQRDVMFYQQSTVGQADLRRWEPWGPAFSNLRPDQKQAPVLGRPLLPAEPNRRTCDVVLTLSVSRAIDLDAAQRATGVPAHELQIIRLECLGGPSQTAVDQSNVDVTANEIANALEDIARAFPSARGVHLFYTGPLALLMRAVGRAHLLPHRVYVYEWFAEAPEGAKYVRAVELTRRELVL